MREPAELAEMDRVNGTVLLRRAHAVAVQAGWCEGDAQP
jgi:hypothetical protein